MSPENNLCLILVSKVFSSWKAQCTQKCSKDGFWSINQLENNV